MINWAKRRVRKWLEIGDPAMQERPTSIECIVNGQLRLMMIRGVIGLKLFVYDNRDQYLIGPGQTSSEQRFWQIWKQYNQRPLVWEDGTPFNPEC